jgi:hypothetical protein
MYRIEGFLFPELQHSILLHPSSTGNGFKKTFLEIWWIDMVISSIWPDIRRIQCPVSGRIFGKSNPDGYADIKKRPDYPAGYPVHLYKHTSVEPPHTVPVPDKYRCVKGNLLLWIRIRKKSSASDTDANPYTVSYYKFIVKNTWKRKKVIFSIGSLFLSSRFQKKYTVYSRAISSILINFGSK